MWTHPLPPPDSGASFSSFGVFVFEIWVLRFRDLGVFVFDRGCFVFEFWMLRFRVLGASFSRFGCFVLRSSFSSASFSKLPFCFTRLFLVLFFPSLKQNLNNIIKSSLGQGVSHTL